MNIPTGETVPAAAVNICRKVLVDKEQKEKKKEEGIVNKR